MAPPKALLFDIGGVVVVSPLQAIVDYEKQNSVPSGWVNFAISKSSPNGYWHRLERGELKLDDEWFEGFSGDLHNQKVWEEFHKKPRGGKERLKDRVDPSQSGHLVNLEAETADSKPIDQDRDSRSLEKGSESSPRDVLGNKEQKSLKDLAQNNPTLLGDPMSLKAEAADSRPTDQDRGAAFAAPHHEGHTSKSSSQQDPAKKPKQFSKENPSRLGDPASLKAETSSSSPTVDDKGAQSPSRSRSTIASAQAPPKIDARILFWAMMTISRTADPYIHPYLTYLSTLHPRPFLLGALSNTITFPPAHPFNAPFNSKSTLRTLFDVFIASAEVGLRKPHREIYELALAELDKVDRETRGSGIQAADVVFLDDIGENLRMGRKAGMRTLKVELGQGEKAVRELEGITGIRMPAESGRVEKAKL